MTTLLGNIVAVVMAGGKGARLRPLTDVRAKPAVSFAGTYRIIDFPLSNCINSGIRKIYVLTQYKSHSLSNHLKLGWSLLPRRLEQYIDEIPAQMQRGAAWYQGTADAIRQNINFIEHTDPEAVLVLSGDHVYKMDFRLLKKLHDDSGARLTIVVRRVPADTARGYGVVIVDDDHRVIGFAEKPEEPQRIPGTDDCYVSMGIYLFARDILDTVLEERAPDFGRDIFPGLVSRGEKIFAFDYSQHNAIQEYQYVTHEGQRLKQLVDKASDSDYWRDVGTVVDYWHAHLDVVSTAPRFNLYGERWPIFSAPIHFPPAKFVHESTDRVGKAIDSIISNGVIISGATVRRCVLGPGIYVHSFSLIENSVLFGGTLRGNVVQETSIGRNCRIRNAIIDKRVTLRSDTVIGYDRAEDERRGLTTYDTGSGEYVVVVPRAFRS